MASAYPETPLRPLLTLFDAAAELEGRLGRISCPVLVTDPEHEQFWPGQPKQLYDRLSGAKALVEFTAEDVKYTVETQIKNTGMRWGPRMMKARTMRRMNSQPLTGIA